MKNAFRFVFILSFVSILSSCSRPQETKETIKEPVLKTNEPLESKPTVTKETNEHYTKVLEHLGGDYVFETLSPVFLNGSIYDFDNRYQERFPYNRNDVRIGDLFNVVFTRKSDNFQTAIKMCLYKIDEVEAIAEQKSKVYRYRFLLSSTDRDKYFNMNLFYRFDNNTEYDFLITKLDEHIDL